MKKKKRVKTSGCPRCGGELKKVAGLVTCVGCGHRPEVYSDSYWGQKYKKDSCTAGSGVIKTSDDY